MIKITKHLKENDMSYFSHCARALGFALWSAAMTIACIIHAFLPFLLEETFSKEIKRMEKKID